METLFHLVSMVAAVISTAALVVIARLAWFTFVDGFVQSRKRGSANVPSFWRRGGRECARRKARIESEIREHAVLFEVMAQAANEGHQISPWYPEEVLRQRAAARRA